MADNFMHEDFHDDIFSKEIIESMKSQMVPSDDVIESLLAKISSERAVSEALRNPEYEVQYRRSRRPKARISFTKYVAVAAAAVIMIAGTVSFIGNEDVEKALEAISGVIDNPSVVIDPSGQGDEVVTPPSDDLGTGIDEPAVQEDEQDVTEGEDSKDTDSKDKDKKDKDSKTDETKDDDTKSKDDKKSEKDKSPKKDDKDTDKKDKQTATGDRSTAQENVTISTYKSESKDWVKEVLSEESAPLILMGESYTPIDARPNVSSFEIGVVDIELPDSDKSDKKIRLKANKIKDVSQDVMFAVRVKDAGRTLIYGNRDYAPNTLGEFLKDSGLNSSLKFSNVIATELIDDESYSHSLSQKGVGDDIRKLIFSQGNAEAIGSAINKRENVYITLISSGELNSMGVTIYFEVNQNGYLYVSTSSGSNYTFYIGEDQCNEFIASYLKNK